MVSKIPTARELDAAWAQVGDGHAAEVLADLSTLGEDAPPAALVLRGLARLELGNPAEAVSDFAAAIAAEGANPVAELYRVLALYRAGDHAAAAKAFADPRLVLLPHRHWLADFLTTFWPMRAAILDRGPDPVDFTDPHGCDFKRREAVLARGGSPAGMARATRKLAQRYHTEGLNLYSKRRLQESRFCLARAHELEPTNEIFAIHYGYVLVLLGEHEMAGKAIASFIEDESAPVPAPPDLLGVHAWVLHSRGEYIQSLRVVSHLHPEGPDDWGSHYLAAVNWLMLGDQPRFREALFLAMDRYFIDTWEQLIHPFLLATRDWMRRQQG